jgi:glyoxylase-like metal-dependent hydrolase (beta-lactamase superfamily II)
MENFVYLVGDETSRSCWIVDPAWDVEKALDVAAQDGYTVSGALLTHAHFDHCNAVDRLLQKQDIPVYMNRRELEFLDTGAPTGLFVNIPRGAVKPVESGDTVVLGDTTLTFVHTPGHTPGSQCFLVNDNLISGDTLFLGSCGRCDMPGGNPHELYRTLHQTLARLPEETILFPGHNYSSRGSSGILGEEKKKNRFFQTTSLEDFLQKLGL